MEANKKKADMPAAIVPPQPGDYLPEAVQKRLIENGLTHPATIYPLAFGIGSAAAGFILNAPLLYLASLVGLLGPLWAVVQIFFLPDSTRKKYLNELDQRREKYKEQLKEKVRGGLQERYATGPAQQHARQGLAQFDRIAQTLQGIQELLEMKLNITELTFHRFLAAAEQTYLSVLDNLKDTVALLKSANSIDPEDVKKRLGALTAEARPLTAADQEEKKALEDRLQLWSGQMQKVENNLAKNERAITEMENISAKVACWQTGQHFAAGDIEAAIAELQDLARFAHTINNTNN